MRRPSLLSASAATLIPALGSLLVVIGARSPHTHANIAANIPLSYVRTSKAFVGPPAPFSPMDREVVSSGGSQVTLGADLFTQDLCASCHGIGGRGGVIGPGLNGLDAATVQDATRTGADGMPVFHLSPDEIQAIVAFLKAQAN